MSLYIDLGGSRMLFRRLDKALRSNVETCSPLIAIYLEISVKVFFVNTRFKFY